jgi:hypothetical protein
MRFISSTFDPRMVVAEPMVNIPTPPVNAPKARAYVPWQAIEFVRAVWEQLLDSNTKFHMMKTDTAPFLPIPHGTDRWFLWINMEAWQIPSGIPIIKGEKHPFFSSYMVGQYHIPDPLTWTIKDPKVQVCHVLRQLWR